MTQVKGLVQAAVSSDAHRTNIGPECFLKEHIILSAALTLDHQRHWRLILKADAA